MISSAFTRSDALRRLESTDFDIVVIGGGITGVGCALDAASRGLRVALIEREDFASGTSSKSSKLVHGGIRYLQQGDVRLVYEALAERQILRRSEISAGDKRRKDCRPFHDQAVRRRWRIIRRRSRSVAPPQMPSFSRTASACSRQASRTSHSPQTSFAGMASASSSGSGKKISGSIPVQAAKLCQVWFIGAERLLRSGRIGKEEY